MIGRCCSSSLHICTSLPSVLTIKNVEESAFFLTFTVSHDREQNPLLFRMSRSLHLHKNVLLFARRLLQMMMLMSVVQRCQKSSVKSLIPCGHCLQLCLCSHFVYFRNAWFNDAIRKDDEPQLHAQHYGSVDQSVGGHWFKSTVVRS